ncbi:MAG: hypothetical protein IPP74_12205 [Alphaproteobacteria bacterium]|nr:hypothetical protein [Alphaproteobacteria bacterium]
MDKDSPLNNSPYLIEWRQVGHAVKVSAIDPQTTLEVSIVGDARVGLDVLKKQAIRKLNHQLNKQRN